MIHRKPLHHRRQIPFYWDKTPSEFSQDPYERYSEMVMRQSALHLANSFTESYPFQTILDWGSPYLAGEKIAEIGCGVGRWVGEMAKANTDASFWGIDYSYQMLRQARDFWVEGKEVTIDMEHRGWEKIVLAGHQLKNLQFGLAKAEALPFESASLDGICSSFLLDRVAEPGKVLEEMFRVLKVGGRMVLVSPLNFQRKAHWARFFPVERLIEFLEGIGFEIIDQGEFEVWERLDAGGNGVCWRGVGVVGERV